jgi:hypothetical protein
MQEFNSLVQKANAWNATSPSWSFGTNECFDQTVALQAYLLSLSPTYWNVTTEGGASNSTPFTYHHHVTLLTPKKNNPLPPMVIDPFKNLGASTTTCKTQTGNQFRSNYPYDCGCCKSHTIPVKPPPDWKMELLQAFINTGLP